MSFDQDQEKEKENVSGLVYTQVVRHLQEDKKLLINVIHKEKEIKTKMRMHEKPIVTISNS